MREIVYVEDPKDGMWVPAFVTYRNDDCYILLVYPYVAVSDLRLYRCSA